MNDDSFFTYMTNNRIEETVSETYTQVSDSEGPYIIESVIRTLLTLRWNPSYNQDKPCSKCGHAYYRHFDTYENMFPIGCKYCPCEKFESAE